MPKITAKITDSQNRISQGDIFEDIDIIEEITIHENQVLIKKINFPFIICLNQECDLSSDYIQDQDNPKNNRLLHLIVAPVFLFEHFLDGEHWGEIFQKANTINRTKSHGSFIIENEIPRYHYIRFNAADKPELIVDFKHFFTISRDQLYRQLSKRYCSVDILFKEKITQRFSFYLSRIGLPEIEG